MLYQIKNGAVELGANRVLRRIDFDIREGDKIAIVGRNGCGKTTLLRLILGEVDLTSNGENTKIVKSGRLRIGCLSQGAFSDLSKTVDEEIREVFADILKMKARLDFLIEEMERSENVRLMDEFNTLQRNFEIQGGYFYEKEYNLLFQKFGFEPSDRERPLCSFSGGQLTKLAFIKLLLERPDVLLLDEPTNHLDITTLEWLEEYLNAYKGAVVIVSHDRMFLDRVVKVVYEIEYGIVKRYVGNYSSFVKQKEENFERDLKAYKAQKAEIARLEALIERFRDTPTKVAMTESKMKYLEHMEILEEPRRFDTRQFKLDFVPNRDTGKEVLRVSGLQIGYDSVLATLSFTQYRQERIGIIGGNGLGKSTLLKTIVGLLPSLGGNFSLGHQVDIGYFDQQMMQTSSEKSVLDDFWDEFPKLSETQARSALGAFLFTGDDVFKSVKSLSGGERVRLALVKILQRKPNFLILDEPTNHMDMLGKEALEAMLSEFEGTILFVSHDRYFVKKIARSLIVFDEAGAKYLPLTYDEYLMRKQTESSEVTAPQATVDVAFKQGKADYARSKERARAERRLAKVNTLILEAEAKIEAKTAELSLEENQSDYERLCRISSEIEALEGELLELYEEQERLESELN